MKKNYNKHYRALEAQTLWGPELRKSKKPYQCCYIHWKLSKILYCIEWAKASLALLWVRSRRPVKWKVTFVYMRYSKILGCSSEAQQGGCPHHWLLEQEWRVWLAQWITLVWFCHRASRDMVLVSPHCYKVAVTADSQEKLSAWLQ